MSTSLPAEQNKHNVVKLHVKHSLSNLFSPLTFLLQHRFYCNIVCTTDVQGRTQDFISGGAGAYGEREPITGVWGQSPQQVQGQSSWWGQGGFAP